MLPAVAAARRLGALAEPDVRLAGRIDCSSPWHANELVVLAQAATTPARVRCAAAHGAAHRGPRGRRTSMPGWRSTRQSASAAEARRNAGPGDAAARHATRPTARDDSGPHATRRPRPRVPSRAGRRPRRRCARGGGWCRLRLRSRPSRRADSSRVSYPAAAMERSSTELDCQGSSSSLRASATRAGPRGTLRESTPGSGSGSPPTSSPPTLAIGPAGGYGDALPARHPRPSKLVRCARGAIPYVLVDTASEFERHIGCWEQDPVDDENRDSTPPVGLQHGFFVREPVADVSTTSRPRTARRMRTAASPPTTRRSGSSGRSRPSRGRRPSATAMRRALPTSRPCRGARRCRRRPLRAGEGPERTQWRRAGRGG